MRRLLIALLLSTVAVSAGAATPYFLDRCGVLWKAAASHDGLVLTGEVDGVVQVSSLVPFIVGIDGNEDQQIQVAADELTGKVAVVWQRNYGAAFSEVFLAIWANGTWERITQLTGAIGENPRFPLVTLSQVHTVVQDPASPDDASSTTTVRDSFLHMTWWQGSGGQQRGRYAILRLSTTADDPEALRSLDLDDLLPVGLGCPSDLPGDVLEHPLFASTTARDHALIFFGSKKVCMFHLVEVTFELEADAASPNPDLPITVQRRRHTPIFGVRRVYQTPQSFNMDGARVIPGNDLRPVCYRVIEGQIQYVVANDLGWSPVRTLSTRDGLTLDQAIPLVENLAR
jgi:hypothetical protein